MLTDIALFFAGVGVAYLVFRTQHRQSVESENVISHSVAVEGHVTRTRIDLLEERVAAVLREFSVPPDVEGIVKEIFDTAVFEEIRQAVDARKELASGDANSSREFAKRMLFFVIRELFHLPFSRYRAFVAWLRGQGYQLPDELTFQSPELYEAALDKVERLNRVGIGVDKVDANLLFSEKRPFRALR